MSVAGINTCPLTLERHWGTIQRKRGSNEEKGYAVAIMMDTEESEIHNWDLSGASSAKAEWHLCDCKDREPCLINELEEIIRASDEVVVTRGDLGAQIPSEQVPSEQLKIVPFCRQLNELVIAAS